MLNEHYDLNLESNIDSIEKKLSGAISSRTGTISYLDFSNNNSLEGEEDAIYHRISYGSNESFTADFAWVNAKSPELNSYLEEKYSPNLRFFEAIASQRSPLVHYNFRDYRFLIKQSQFGKEIYYITCVNYQNNLPSNFCNSVWTKENPDELGQLSSVIILKGSWQEDPRGYIGIAWLIMNIVLPTGIMTTVVGGCDPYESRVIDGEVSYVTRVHASLGFPSQVCGDGSYTRRQWSTFDGGTLTGTVVTVSSFSEIPELPQTISIFGEDVHVDNILKNPRISGLAKAYMGYFTKQNLFNRDNFATYTATGGRLETGAGFYLGY